MNENFVITSQMTEDYFEMSKPLFETVKKYWKGRFIIGCIDFEPKNYDGEYYLMKRSEIKSFRTDFPSNRINYVCPQAGEFIDLIPNINDKTIIIQIDSDTIMQRPFTDEELEKIWVNDNELLSVYNSNPPVNLFEVCKNLSFKTLDKYKNLNKFYEFTASMIIANKKTFKNLRDHYVNSMNELASVCQHHAGGQWLINKIAYENFDVKIIDSTFQCGSWYMTFNTKVIDNLLYLNDKMVIFNHTKYLDSENILTFLNEHIKQ